MPPPRDVTGTREVHLREGRRRRLVGMPADDVGRLAKALGRAREDEREEDEREENIGG